MSTESNGRLDQSRRLFLAHTAMFAGAGAVLAAAGNASARQPELAQKPKPRIPIKDGETIRIGVIGTGGMGTGHCAAFVNLNKSRNGNVQVVAISDPWPRNLNSAGDKLEKQWQPDVKLDRYADHNQLLARQDIHAVVIASPEHWHAQHAIDSILAGKDVYCEKPMTLHLDEAVRLHKLMQANPDMILQVGTQKMALPSYNTAREWIREGLIGTPTCSQTSYCRNTPAGEWNYYQVDPNWQAGKDVDWEKWCGPLGQQPFDPYVLNRWRRYRKTSTGIIGDLLVHVTTPLMVAMDQGWPVRVTAIGSHLVDKKMENHDTVNLLVEFETGHQMIVMGATNNDTGLTPMIRGPKGNIEVTDGSLRFTPQKPYAEELEERRAKLANIGDDQDAHRMNWLGCLRTRTKPYSDTEMGLKVMVIVDLATRSMWEGGAWTFDPKTLAAKRV